MMTEHTKKHLWYYISFIVVELTGLGLLFYLAYDKNLQFLTICFMASFYIGWAVLHHYHHHNITLKIMIEYILIGILAVVISFLVLQQI
jgi:hypothetical protein